MDTGSAPNDAMAESWNGLGGQHWVAHADRHDRALAAYGDAVLRAAAIEPGDRVLDVGCGTGALTRAAAHLAGDGATLGVDIGQPMVDAARAETAREGGPPNVAFEQADAQVRPFPADGLDVVISRFGVMFFDDTTAAFTNLRRGMVEGGRLTFVCWQDIFVNDWMLVPVGAMAEHLGLPEVAGPDAPGPFALSDSERVRTVLGAAGFEDVTLADEAHPMWLGSDLDDAVAYMRGQPMARLMFEDKDPALVETAVASLRTALAPHVTADGLSLPGRAWLVTARAA